MVSLPGLNVRTCTSVKSDIYIGPFSSVSTPQNARVRSFFRIFRDLQSPLSGRKKSASTFLPPEKKEHLEDFTVRRCRSGKEGREKETI